MWLETMWSLRRLFCYVYKQELGDSVFDGWIEVMPSKQIMRYCDFRGSTTYRYRMLGLYIFQYRNGFYGDNRRGEAVSDEVKAAIEKAHANLFYRELENALCEETVSVEHNPTSQGSDSGHQTSERRT